MDERMDEIRTLQGDIEERAKEVGRHRTNRRGILESKVWTGLKALSGEKVGFRAWRNTFKNAFSQARPG